VLNNEIKFLQKYKIENHSISLFTHDAVGIPASFQQNKNQRYLLLYCSTRNAQRLMVNANTAAVLR
jgi:hypothetical protein